MSVEDAFKLPNLVARGDSFASEPDRYAPGVVDALAAKVAGTRYDARGMNMVNA